MDKRIIYAVIVGAVLFAAVIALHVFTNKKELNPIFLLIPSFIVGIVAVGFKRGFLMSFALTLIFAIVGVSILQPEMLRGINDPNVVATFAIFFLIYSAIGGILGAVGGFAGRKIFKK